MLLHGHGVVFFFAGQGACPALVELVGLFSGNSLLLMMEKRTDGLWDIVKDWREEAEVFLKKGEYRSFFPIILVQKI